MSLIRLSICIPTYNFGDFIGATLESILTQATDEVEVVIGDGGSTDNTAEVVRRYQSRFAHLIYRNFGKRGGVDLDLSKTRLLLVNVERRCSETRRNSASVRRNHIGS
jgi:abequosyltransferase